jgi:hypothetical protein
MTLTAAFNSNDMPQMPFTPTFELDQFSTTFDDPLSYQTNIFDTFLDDNTNNDENLPVDLDNKLLGFGAPLHKTPLLDQTGQTWPRMSAELNGMFCVAEDVFEGDTAGRPLELTCYRRNLFQISGAITLSRTASHVLLDQARRVGIYDLVATLSATESIEGKATDIIAVPWKTGNATAAVSTDEKAGAVPADVHIDLSSNQETDPMFVSVQIAWGRLQFKYATANNGRRKGLQQHYRIQITLMAKLEGSGEPIKLAEIQSNPIVVRGRSPKNFDSSKDVPLSERKAESGSRARTASNIASTPQWIEPALSQGTKQFYASTSVQVRSHLLFLSYTLKLNSVNSSTNNISHSLILQIGTLLLPPPRSIALRKQQTPLQPPSDEDHPSHNQNGKSNRKNPSHRVARFQWVFHYQTKNPTAVLPSVYQSSHPRTNDQLEHQSPVH